MRKKGRYYFWTLALLCFYLLSQYFSDGGGISCNQEKLKCGFIKKTFIMNAPHIFITFWRFCCSKAPKSDGRVVQLHKGAFIINDFLRNPHFRNANASYCSSPQHSVDTRGCYPTL